MRKRGIFIVLGVVLLIGCSQKSGILPDHLTCEYIENPSVVDELQPRLAWVNTAVDVERGQAQSAYQVRVASSLRALRTADLWDSGKRDGSKCSRITYEGKELLSGMECWWQVRVWDANDLPSEWSDPACWRMGLLNREDWKAKWIGAPWQGEEALPRPPYPEALPDTFPPPAPLLRKEFEVEKKVESAVAYVTGLGYFELRLNGQKVGDDVLVPNQTNYGKRPGLEDAYIHLPDEFHEYRVMYLAYDVEEYLQAGPNAIGAILGNGFYNPAKYWAEGYGTPRFLCQVHIQYRDGSEEVLTSDENWKAQKGPVLMDMVYYGEIYDARQEQPGWDRPGFDDASWETVALREVPAGKLVAHTAHPDRVTERFQPLSIEKKGKGHYLVDFGTEISGWVRLNQARGPEGRQVDLQFNGNLFSGKNSYIFSGREAADYAPRFNWFVFSGVEITGWPGELKKEDLTAEAVNTHIEASADFLSSNELFNEINTIWRRSQTDNMHGGIASDCPHRERSGYTGDGQLACMTVLHNYDARNFYHKWMEDIRGAQNPVTGYVPNGAPWQPGCGGGPGWGAAICIIPWEFYMQYGSMDMLEDNYEAMQDYVRYMLKWTREGIMHSQRRAKDGSVLKWFNLGEWVPPGMFIPDEMVHSFYLWYCTDIVSRVASVLGREEEFLSYYGLSLKIKAAFQTKFYDPENGSYGDGGGNILALKMGVPDEHYERVISALKENIRRNKGHLDTGITGTRFFFEVLAENGMQQLAYEAMNKRTEPSFGRWIDLGSTTTREQWDEGGSHNHPMFGGGLTWFYRNLAGMQADPSKPGYRHIIFKPGLVDEMEYVTYFNMTSYGKAGITWRQGEGFTMNIQVPVSCTATVWIPASDTSDIREGGLPLGSLPEITYLRKEDKFHLFGVESGIYHFSVKR